MAPANEAFLFKCAAGVFSIRGMEIELWELRIDEKILGAYTSAGLAAEAVARHATGWAVWDTLPASPDDPVFLSDWQKAI